MIPITQAQAIPTRIDLSSQAVMIVSTASQRDAHAGSHDRVVEILNRRGAAAEGLIIPER